MFYLCLGVFFFFCCGCSCELCALCHKLENIIKLVAWATRHPLGQTLESSLHRANMSAAKSTCPSQLSICLSICPSVCALDTASLSEAALTVPGASQRTQQPHINHSQSKAKESNQIYSTRMPKTLENCCNIILNAWRVVLKATHRHSQSITLPFSLSLFLLNRVQVSSFESKLSRCQFLKGLFRLIIASKEESTLKE